ncbi:MAG: hypothetical protein AAGK97_02900, partial [Bacteroidota bacterium]
TSVPSRVNNFSMDVNYEFELTNDISAKAGFSYIKGCAYCQSWPVFHFNPCNNYNPAISYYATVNIADLTLQSSFTKTKEIWPGTFNPHPPLNEFPASKVSAFDVGAKYNLNPDDEVNYILSAEFSNFISGPEGAPWQRQSQLVLGINAQVQKSNRIFLEYFRTEGYVPLN